MKRILRNIFTVVTCDDRARPRLFGDEILHAEPIPKVLVGGRTWQGDLEPVLDAYLEQLQPLENGLTLGRVLHAEEIPAVLDLGAAWLGTFRDRVLASREEKPGAVGVTEVLRGVEAVRRQMGAGNSAAVADGIRRLRDAALRVSDAVRDLRTGDAARHMGDFSQPVSIAEINRRNREHAARNAAPTVDPRVGCSGDPIQLSAPPTARA